MIVGEVHRRGEKTPERFVEGLSASMEVETISAERDQATFLASRR